LIGLFLFIQGGVVDVVICNIVRFPSLEEKPIADECKKNYNSELWFLVKPKECYLTCRCNLSIPQGIAPRLFKEIENAHFSKNFFTIEE